MPGFRDAGQQRILNRRLGEVLGGVGVSTGGNTLGTTGTVFGPVVLAGGAGITLSQSTLGNLATVTIVGNTATAGGPSIAAGTQTATSGTVVFSNSNGLTFGLSNSSVVTASVSREPSIAAGTQTASSGTVVFSNSNNITFGLSNSSVVTASASFAQSTQPAVNAAAGTQTATSGTVVFSNSNGITFGMSNSSVITASHNGVTEVGAQDFGGGAGLNVGVPRWVWASSAGFNVAFSKSVNGISGSIIAHAQAAALADSAGTQTSGTVIFSNSNGVSFGLNAGTMTASVAAGGATRISGWEAYAGAALNATTVGDIQLWIQRAHFAHSIDATRANVILQISNSSNASQTLTIRMAAYTMSGSTASLASSASRTIAVNATSLYTANSNYRYRSIALGTWAITPGDYLFGVVVSIATGGTSGTYNWKARNDLPLDGREGGTTQTENYFWHGSYTAVTGNVVNSFRPQDVAIEGGAGGSDMNNQPWFNLLGTF